MVKICLPFFYYAFKRQQGIYLSFLLAVVWNTSAVKKVLVKKIEILGEHQFGQHYNSLRESNFANIFKGIVRMSAAQFLPVEKTKGMAL
jgi:hypothetical protein